MLLCLNGVEYKSKTLINIRIIFVWVSDLVIGFREIILILFFPSTGLTRMLINLILRTVMSFLKHFNLKMKFDTLRIVINIFKLYYEISFNQLVQWHSRQTLNFYTFFKV